MNRLSFRRLTTAFVAAALITLTGCTAGFIGEAARSNLASFLVDILSTAVNETVGP